MKKICKNCKWRDEKTRWCTNNTKIREKEYWRDDFEERGSNRVDELVIMLNGKVEEFDRVTTNKRGVSTVEFKSGMSMTSSEFSIATNEKDVIAAIISNGWQNA